MYQNETDFNLSQSRYEAVPMAKTFLAQVFSWMFFALSISAVTAYYFGTDESLRSYLFGETGITGLGWIVTLAPFGFVLLMSLGFQRLSANAITLLFAAFAILMGMSLSFILVVYTAGSVFLTFAVTAGMFGIMAVTGYTTQIDLSKFGSLMMMGLIGIIIASLVNMFMRSSGMDYIISFLGVVIFTGLTAYDVQKLKRIGAGVQTGAESTRKLTIMGAMTLYLDFINLFLFLLRFLGNRK
jgi:FtsH-binding integral membrane protein